MFNIKFISLGCPKNQVDSEYMQGLISEENHLRFTSKLKKADIIIINTCSFIEDAKQESIDTILNAAQYKNKGKCKALIVTGCLPQRYKDQIMELIPEIDAVLGTGKQKEIIEVIKNISNYKKINLVDKPDFEYNYNSPRRMSDSHYAFVKVSEGCNNKCSYCVIPDIRGPVKSRKIEDVYQEVKNLLNNDVKEIILIAQDLTQYGIDIYNGPMLIELLKKLVSIDKNFWIRLMYCYPERISEELIKLISKEKKICNYLDIPLQHSSNKIRKRMKRQGKRKELINKIYKIREIIPDIHLRTSIIVGFPGEKKEDFQDLLNFIKKIEFERLGVFKYSREEGTPAAVMSEQISEKTKDKRYNKIMEEQKYISLEKNKKLIGKTFRVIIDEINEDYAIARSQYDAPEIDNQIIIYETDLNKGNIIKCHITEAYEYDLIGEKIYEFAQ